MVGPIVWTGPGRTGRGRDVGCGVAWASVKIRIPRRGGGRLAQSDGTRYAVGVDREQKAALWAFVGMGIAFKVITSLIIFALRPTAASALFLLVMQWYWLLLPLPLVVVPALFWYRLWRVRRKRRRLIQAEWAVEPEAGWNPTSVHGTM